ncbi:MAG: hypothetical protein ACTSU2_00495 [Promethearchaeota archaeon]
MGDLENKEQNGDNPKLENDDDEDEELKMLRLKRMQELLKRKQLYEKQKEQRANVLDINTKIDMIVKAILTPDAYQYLMGIKERDSNLYHRIRGIIIPPQIINEIDALMYYMRQGRLRTGVVNKTEIQIIERKLLGIGPQITIKKRNEESKSLSSFLKEDL